LSNTKDNETRTLSGPPPDENGTKTSRKGHKRADTVAVALEYDSGSEFAPKVLAGGRGKVAEQILQIAFDRGIKVREDADLAEMLSAIDIDSEIPVEAFAAVAEILTYVYRANGNMPDFMEEEMHEAHQNHQQERENDDADKPEKTP
jgi:flagellar biosynthesis protein